MTWGYSNKITVRLTIDSDNTETEGSHFLYNGSRVSFAIWLSYFWKVLSNLIVSTQLTYGYTQNKVFYLTYESTNTTRNGVTLILKILYEKNSKFVLTLNQSWKTEKLQNKHFQYHSWNTPNSFVFWFETSLINMQENVRMWINIDKTNSKY